MPISDEVRATLPPEALEYIKALEADAVTPAATGPSDADVEAAEFEKAMSGLPEPVRKAMIATQRENVVQKAQLRALTDERETERFEDMAKGLVHLPGVDQPADGKPSEFAATMRKSAESNPAAFDGVFKVLKAADAAIAESGFFKEIGTGAIGASNAEDSIIAIAKAAVAKDPTLDLSEQIAVAAEANPDLYAQHAREN